MLSLWHQTLSWDISGSEMAQEMPVGAREPMCGMETAALGPRPT